MNFRNSLKIFQRSITIIAMCLQRLQQVSKNTSLVRKHKLNKYYHLLNVKHKYVDIQSFLINSPPYLGDRFLTFIHNLHHFRTSVVIHILQWRQYKTLMSWSSYREILSVTMLHITNPFFVFKKNHIAKRSRLCNVQLWSLIILNLMKAKFSCQNDILSH